MSNLVVHKQSPTTPSQPAAKGPQKGVLASMRVVSYNICNPAYAHHFPDPNYQQAYGLANMKQRYGELIANIKALNADILTLQECSPNVQAHLSKSLSEYTICYQPHINRNEDGVAILFKKARFVYLGESQKDVDVSSQATGSKPINRTHFTVDLMDRATQKILRVATGHIFGDPNLPMACKEHAEALKELAEEENDNAIEEILVATDFNAEADSEVAKVFLGEGYRTDGDYSATEPKHNPPRRLDFVAINSKTHNPLISKQLSDDISIPYPEASDHLPAVSEFIPASFIQKEFNKKISDAKMQKRLQRFFPQCSERGERQDDVFSLISAFEYDLKKSQKNVDKEVHSLGVAISDAFDARVVLPALNVNQKAGKNNVKGSGQSGGKAAENFAKNALGPFGQLVFDNFQFPAHLLLPPKAVKVATDLLKQALIHAAAKKGADQKSPSFQLRFQNNFDSYLKNWAGAHIQFNDPSLRAAAQAAIAAAKGADTPKKSCCQAFWSAFATFFTVTIPDFFRAIGRCFASIFKR